MQVTNPNHSTVNSELTPLPRELITKIAYHVLETEPVSFKEYFAPLRAFAPLLYENDDSRVDKVCAFLKSPNHGIQWHQHKMTTGSITTKNLIDFALFTQCSSLPDPHKMISEQFTKLLAESENREETAAECVVEAVKRGAFSFLLTYSNLKMQPTFGNMNDCGSQMKGFDKSILHLAVQSHNFNSLTTLIVTSKGFSEDAMNSALSVAAKKFDGCFTMLLTAATIYKMTFDDDALKKALFTIVKHTKQPSAVHMLLKVGADPNVPDSEGSYPLHYAVQSNHYEMVSALLVEGADPNVADGEGNYPLHYAVQSNQYEMLGALLTKDADPNIPDSKGNCPLHYAIQANHYEAVRLLLFKGADPNVADGEGNYPLHYAVQFEQTRTVDSLFERHANPDCCDSDGNTPLHIAVRQNFPLLVADLMIHGAQLKPNNANETPLDLAQKLDNSDEMLYHIYHPGRSAMLAAHPLIEQLCMNPNTTNEQRTSFRRLYMFLLRLASLSEVSDVTFNKQQRTY